MATYEYGCPDCGERFEVRASISQETLQATPVCPTCGGKQAVRLFSPVVVMGGSKRRRPGGCSPGGGSGCCG